MGIRYLAAQQFIPPIPSSGTWTVGPDDASDTIYSAGSNAPTQVYRICNDSGSIGQVMVHLIGTGSGDDDETLVDPGDCFDQSVEAGQKLSVDAKDGQTATGTYKNVTP